MMQSICLDTDQVPNLKADGQSMAAPVGRNDVDRAERFRAATLPHLDDLYTLARYLLRNDADADDAVQECYLRALRYFDGFNGTAIKPWLMAILRNVCHAEFARRSGGVSVSVEADVAEDAPLLWQEEAPTAETKMLRRDNAETIRRLVAALPQPFRETLVLRDVNDLSYREIAEVTGVPIGTVMSRLGRARSRLRQAWIEAESEETTRRENVEQCK
jgi:RNA polymerase sigma-70 factor, ECF subfamily